MGHRVAAVVVWRDVHLRHTSSFTHACILACRLDEKLKKLDEQLIKHREAIKRSRPGPAQEAAKRRALNVRGMSQPQHARSTRPTADMLPARRV